LLCLEDIVAIRASEAVVARSAQHEMTSFYSITSKNAATDAMIDGRIDIRFAVLGIPTSSQQPRVQ
jgi:hypothetical protein